MSRTRTLSRYRFRKGISGLVGAAIAVAVIMAAASYILVYLPRPSTLLIDPLIEKLDSYINERISIGHLTHGFYIANEGSSPVSIAYLAVYNKLTNRVMLYRADAGSPCSLSKTNLAPGETATIVCSNNEILLSIVTSDGRVFVRDPRLSYPYLIPRAVPQKILLSPEVVRGLMQYISEPRGIRIISNRSLNLYRLWRSENSIYSVNIQANVSLAIILRTPETRDRLNIMLIGSGAHGLSPGGSMLRVNGSSIDLTRLGYVRFRVAIENFSGIIRVYDASNPGRSSEVRSPSIIGCLVNYGKQCRIDISGFARGVSLYTNSSSVSPSQSTTEAFFISGDLDENSYPELIFVTQDFGTGTSSTVNDRIVVPTSRGSLTQYALDRFESPIRIIFRDYPINNSKFSIAIVSVKMFFWDSSEDDVLDNDNLVLLRVGIYDMRTGKYLYSVELSYYELCRYRTTKPITFSYVVKDFLLNIPSPSETGYGELYIAIDILDPYLVSGTRNDAEIIFGLEYVGLVLGVRA
ncbi:MAG: hypothetical protein RMI56_03725 [Sulfolobales archaeon]|nr:hypothetical protein [Sulfolobales archaeon]